MPNKLLTALWVIIIAGSAIIAINIFRPNPKLEEDTLKLTGVKTTGKNQQIDTKPNQQSKTYQEYIKAGDSYFQAGDFEKAINNYKQASQLTTNATDAQNKLGESYLKNNEPKEAQKIFSSLVSKNPDFLNFKIALAHSHINSREIEEAKAIIWQLDEKNPLVKYYRGITLVLYKNFDEAKNTFKEIEKLTPKPDQKILDKNQKFLDAYKTFSLYTGSDNLYLELLLAKSLTDNEEYSAAIPLLFDVLNTKNNYRDAWIVLGFAYLNTAKISEAIDAFSQAKDLTPEKPETLFYLGLSYFANNEIDKAIHYIELADKYGFEPKDQISLKLADLYLLRKNYKKSAEKYEKVISLNPKKIDVFTRAVWLNIDKLDKPEQALTLATKAIQNHPNKAMSYNLIGWAYTALDNYQHAKENLDKALSMDQKLDAVYLNMGWLYEKQKQNKLAQEYYKKAYNFGHGNSVSNLAAVRYNNLDDLESQKSFQVNSLRSKQN